MAITQSPTRILSLSPNCTCGRAFWLSTFNSAKSVFKSLPRSLALRLVPSGSVTSISSASSITCALVTTNPDGSMMKPEPRELTLRGAGRLPSRCWSLKNSSKNSRKGEFSGNSGSGTRDPPATVCEVEIFTTAGDSRSAISATEPGPCACVALAQKRLSTIESATAQRKSAKAMARGFVIVS